MSGFRVDQAYSAVTAIHIAVGDFVDGEIQQVFPVDLRNPCRENKDLGTPVPCFAWTRVYLLVASVRISRPAWNSRVPQRTEKHKR